MRESQSHSWRDGGLARFPLKRWVYRNYRFSSSFRFWFRRRFTWAGIVVVAAWAVTGILGADTDLVVAYQAFCLLTVMLVMAFAWSRFVKPMVDVERRLPKFGTVGEPLEYSMEIRNRTGQVQSGLTLIEELGDPRPTLDEFLSTPEPGESERNWFDRAFGYYRWAWLTGRNEAARVREVALPVLGPWESTELSVQLQPQRRGVLRLIGVSIGSPDPFGLFKGFRRTGLTGTVVVLPKRYPIAPTAMPGSARYQRGGVALAASIGESEEFISLREYRPGDPIRHIHWRSWARVGQPVVREFEDEYVVRHALILDTFVDCEETEPFEEAVSVAASFACTLDTRDSLLDLLFAGPQAFCFTAGRGVGQMEQILEVLAEVSPSRAGGFEVLERLVLEHSRAVSGCICVFLDWDERRKRLVQILDAREIPVLICWVRGKGGPREPEPEPAEWLERLQILEPGKIAEGLARMLASRAETRSN